jgi:hypothetical protein
MEQPVFTIAEFCSVHRTSRSRLYQEWKRGTGPRFFYIGAKILITAEAAADWRREREAAQAKQTEAA